MTKTTTAKILDFTRRNQMKRGGGRDTMDCPNNKKEENAK